MTYTNPQTSRPSTAAAPNVRDNASHEQSGLPTEAQNHQKNGSVHASAQAGEVSPEVLAQVLGRDGDKGST